MLNDVGEKHLNPIPTKGRGIAILETIKDKLKKMFSCGADKVIYFTPDIIPAVDYAPKEISGVIIPPETEFFIKDNYIYSLDNEKAEYLSSKKKPLKAKKLCQGFDVIGIEWVEISKDYDCIGTYKEKKGYFVLKYKNDICLAPLANMNFGSVFEELRNLIYDFPTSYAKEEEIVRYIQIEAKGIIDFVIDVYPELYQKAVFSNTNELREAYRQALNLLALSDEEKNNTHKSKRVLNEKAEAVRYWNFYRQNLFLATRDLPLIGFFSDLNRIKTAREEEDYTDNRLNANKR